MEQYLIDTKCGIWLFFRFFSASGMSLMDIAIDAVPKISVITQIAQCVNIRKGKKIKTPDAIIAATALAYSFTLITNNEKDFAKIKGLKIINPRKT